jgi:hypothetical protein
MSGIKIIVRINLIMDCLTDHETVRGTAVEPHVRTIHPCLGTKSGVQCMSLKYNVRHTSDRTKTSSATLVLILIIIYCEYKVDLSLVVRVDDE